MGGIGDEEEFREPIQVLCFEMGKFVTDLHDPSDDNLAEEDNEKRPKQGVNQSIWESRRVNF